MLFRTKNESNSLSLKLVLNELPIEAKYLGVILDHKLTYEPHIKQVKSRLIKGNAMLAKVRHFVPTELLTNTYNAHIHSHIDYGHLLWGYAAQTHINTIAVQQKKALRLMNFVKYEDRRESTQPLFKKSKVLPLDKNLKLLAGKTLWKVANSLLCPPINTLFKPRENS